MGCKAWPVHFLEQATMGKHVVQRENVDYQVDGADDDRVKLMMVRPEHGL
jgi:hypothetical protein